MARWINTLGAGAATAALTVSTRNPRITARPTHANKQTKDAAKILRESNIVITYIVVCCTVDTKDAWFPQSLL
jgi:beta-lactam-binding protein with PASTA domain